MHTRSRSGAVVLSLVLAACSSVDQEPADGQEPAPPAATTGQALPKAADAAGLVARERFAGQNGLAELAYAPAPCCWLPPAEDRETYAHQAENPVHLASEQPVSTFSIDVDTAAYANVRRFLNDGRLPPEDAVRVEELVNYFPYAYPAPETRDRPFAISTALAPAPWDGNKVLLQVALKGYEIPAAQRAPANLVFLVDVSGSMQDPAKLPLLKSAFRLMSRQLKATDRVALVVYAGAAGTVLEPTPGDQHGKIRAALDRLEAGGSTNGGDGIRLAYDLAQQGYISGGINRIILATDGDFNVGTTDFDALIDLVEREREHGVSLTTLGFGTGNYNDQLVERLADAGNGNHAYIDTLAEGRKVLVEQLTGTLQTIAKDVKVQVEFNPSAVAEYRLIGYENRALRREDFNNDRVDAGEIGAGHTVTALYELTLAGSPARLIDPLRYGATPPPRDRAASGGELAFVRLRYKAPEGGQSRLIEQPVQRTALQPLSEAPELRFAAAVAAFGQKLRGSDYLGSYSWADIGRLAAGARGDDPEGYRGEFVSLVRLADAIEMADGRPGTPLPSPGPAPEEARLRR